MAEKNAQLGGRLPLLKPDRLDAEHTALYQKLQKSLIAWSKRSGFKGDLPSGELIGPFNVYLYSTGITPGFLEWVEADAQHTTLTKRVHEVVILTVGSVWKSPYELYAHSKVAEGVGLSPKAVEALVQGRSDSDLTAAEDIARRFTSQLTSEHEVSDDLYREAEGEFGHRALVDMTYLIGMYLLTCAQLNAFKIPRPPSEA